MTAEQCRSLFEYMVPQKGSVAKALDVWYYRCAQEEGHSAPHRGHLVDLRGAVIDRTALPPMSWHEREAMNAVPGSQPEPHPHDPDQIPFDLETP